MNEIITEQHVLDICTRHDCLYLCRDITEFLAVTANSLGVVEATIVLLMQLEQEGKLKQDSATFDDVRQCMRRVGKILIVPTPDVY